VEDSPKEDRKHSPKEKILTRGTFYQGYHPPTGNIQLSFSLRGGIIPRKRLPKGTQFLKGALVKGKSVQKRHMLQRETFPQGKHSPKDMMATNYQGDHYEKGNIFVRETHSPKGNIYPRRTFSQGEHSIKGNILQREIINRQDYSGEANTLSRGRHSYSKGTILQLKIFG